MFGCIEVTYFLTNIQFVGFCEDIYNLTIRLLHSSIQFMIDSWDY